jgi:2-dehydro-3-deoxyphosphooctonate aldolase (KDO 8-P synthase)
MDTIVRIGNDVLCGAANPLVLIAGPCVLESPQTTNQIITECKRVCEAFKVQYVFKASFDKANRTSVYADRGSGIEHAREEFMRIRQVYGVPVVTDIHQPWHADHLPTAVDMIQIPAMLMRQTDLLKAAALSKLPVLVKKSQQAAPESMRHVIQKLEFYGCTQAMLCERGSMFGYDRLVNDFAGLQTMHGLGVPVAFDATHSTQRTGPGCTDGRPELIHPLARAAAAFGINALFIETHPEPENALSDGRCMLPLHQLWGLIEQVTRIRKAIFDS